MRPIVLQGGRCAAPDSPKPETLHRQLVVRARDGDLDAWARLYQETYDPVFRHACYLTGQAALAEDLAQDAFARAFAQIGEFRGLSFVAWVRGIVLNLVRMHWRRSRTSARVRDDLQTMNEIAQTGGTDPHHRQVQDQRMRILYDVLGTLPERLREAFVLRELEGLSPTEAAAQLKISTGNLNVRTTRARQRIHKELVRRGHLEASK